MKGILEAAGTAHLKPGEVTVSQAVGLTVRAEAL